LLELRELIISMVNIRFVSAIDRAMVRTSCVVCVHDQCLLKVHVRRKRRCISQAETTSV